MGSAVIVAIPSVDDRAYRLSSEKVPHLTLLYLGEEYTNEEIIHVVEYVKHAASTMAPFYMDVDHRGTLGDDGADVVFFDKKDWTFPRVRAFRHSLLLDNTVKRLSDAAEKYPEWTPHLTLGYPDSPANVPSDPDQSNLHNVFFDHVAVWIGDYEGPSFRLEEPEYTVSEVSMSSSETTVAGQSALAELFHYGVKGMQWGVRNAGKPQGKIGRATTKAKTALDAGNKVITEGEKKLIFLPHESRAKAAAATQSRLLVQAASVNKSSQFKGKDLRTDKALQDAYFKEVESRAKKIYADELGLARAKAWGDLLGVDTTRERTQLRVWALAEDVRHSDEQETLLQLDFELDDLGQIKNITVPDSFLKQSSEGGPSILHYGVKGMKWGVRTADRNSSPTVLREKKLRVLNSKDVTVSQRKPGTLVRAKGGQRQKASDDAVKAVAARQKAKKSTTDSLSNEELKAANERMRLEQEFSKLDAKTKRRGESFVSRLFQSPEARQLGTDLAKRVAETS